MIQDFFFLEDYGPELYDSQILVAEGKGFPACGCIKTTWGLDTAANSWDPISEILVQPTWEDAQKSAIFVASPPSQYL